MSKLFTTFALGDLPLANRIVLAPMTRNRADAAGAASDLAAVYYAQRAGAGLIVSEASQISPQGVGYPNTPGIHTDAQEAAWRRVTDAVHAAGGRIFLQLWHVGRISHPLLQPDGNLPVAPSAIAAAGKAWTAAGQLPFPVPRELDITELPCLVADFAAAALRARRAGFDGVEIHAANGYLLDQFLRDGTNRRRDSYGGTVANRARLLLEVAEAVAAAWAPGRVGVRISPQSSNNDIADSDPRATFGYVARALSPLGLAYLHIVEPITDVRAGSIARLAPELRAAFEGTVIVAGGYDRDAAETALRDGDADLIGFGTPFIANPDLAERLRRDAPLAAADRTTFYGGGARGYIDYPALVTAA